MSKNYVIILYFIHICECFYLVCAYISHKGILYMYMYHICMWLELESALFTPSERHHVREQQVDVALKLRVPVVLR